MSNILPDVPENLKAEAISHAITDKNYQHALKIYKQCLDRIASQSFPCYLAIDKYESNGILHAIFEKLQAAGYQAKILSKTEEENDGRNETMTVEKFYIMIENPLVKNN